ncbi:MULTISPECIES: hypothetical protein [unclassified Aeromonas]|uniref:hypothetical protein n=1 Tax=unclassified Aeromonas TaxID=257493 RepID=UPI003528E1F4
MDDNGTSQTASYNTDGENRFVDRRRSNIKSDLIEITEDKLENILLKYLKRMGTRRAWLAPIGLLISVVLANVSATFNEKFGVAASTWEAIFILAAIASGVWFIASIVIMITHWRESSLESLISRIKNAEN